MNSRDIYKSGYKFAKDANDRNLRILKITTFVLPIFILLVLCVGFIQGTNFFKGQSDDVNRVFEENKAAEEETKKERTESLENQYKAVKIPYQDPAGRFSIIFIMPFVSPDIAVVINSNKDYDVVKSEADKIIAEAKKQVQITSVSYINNF